MGYWNHRVVDLTEEGDDSEPVLAVREVYYEDNGTPRGHTEPFTQSETLDGLEECLNRMLQAVRKAKELGPRSILGPSNFPNKET